MCGMATLLAAIMGTVYPSHTHVLVLHVKSKIWVSQVGVEVIQAKGRGPPQGLKVLLALGGYVPTESHDLLARGFTSPGPRKRN